MHTSYIKFFLDVLCHVFTQQNLGLPPLTASFSTTPTLTQHALLAATAPQFAALAKNMESQSAYSIDPLNYYKPSLFAGLQPSALSQYAAVAHFQQQEAMQRMLQAALQQQYVASVASSTSPTASLASVTSSPHDTGAPAGTVL